MGHPPFSDIEQFVSGGLTASADFESHLSHCDACAALLAREARVELVACAAARELKSRRDWLSHLKGPGYVMGVGMALAASLLLLFRTMTSAVAAPVGGGEDVHGQPAVSFSVDAGIDGSYLALLDAG